MSSQKNENKKRLTRAQRMNNKRRLISPKSKVKDIVPIAENDEGATGWDGDMRGLEDG